LAGAGVRRVVEERARDVPVEAVSTLAAVLMAVLAGVLYDTARLFVAPLPAALATLAGVFGSQVWSTASRGLWSVTWQLLLLALVLRSLAAREQRGSHRTKRHFRTPPSFCPS
jgi:hypothetical protein